MNGQYKMRGYNRRGTKDAERMKAEKWEKKFVCPNSSAVPASFAFFVFFAVIIPRLALCAIDSSVHLRVSRGCNPLRIASSKTKGRGETAPACLLGDLLYF